MHAAARGTTTAGPGHVTCRDRTHAVTVDIKSSQFFPSSVTTQKKKRKTKNPITHATYAIQMTLAYKLITAWFVLTAPVIMWDAMYVYALYTCDHGMLIGLVGIAS